MQLKNELARNITSLSAEVCKEKAAVKGSLSKFTGKHSLTGMV